MAVASIGSYFCEPGDQFRVMRSYLTHWRVRSNNDNAPVVWSGSQFIFPSATVPGFHLYVTILPEFTSWSSNAYTLDHIITEVYYQIPPSPIVPYGAVVLRYLWDSSLNAMVLELQSELPDTTAYFDLADGGGGYWMAPVPN